jgi:hypothetical protein
MKNLILILWFVLFLSSSASAGVEYVTEQVCHAMSGCVLDTKTGECPDCVIERRKVVHTHEETPVVVEKPEVLKRPVVKTTPKKETIKKKGNWTCIVGPCDFIDENGNLIEKS